MPAQQPEVAVAFVIREKFAWTLASLQRLYALAGAPFRLYFVDGVYPREVRSALEAFLAGKDNVVRVAARRFLYPSEALNLVLPRIREPWVFLLQNDVLVGRDALASVFDTARRLDCDAVSPDVLDNDFGAPAVHRESTLPLRVNERDNRIWIEPEAASEMRDGHRRLHHFEVHCLFLKAQALRGIGPLPPLSVHDHVDLSLALWRAGNSIYLDERAKALFMDAPPQPLRDYERTFFRFRWDWGRARQSQDYVRVKWRMGNLYDALPFVERQHSALRTEAVLTRYESPLEVDQWPAEISA